MKNNEKKIVSKKTLVERIKTRKDMVSSAFRAGQLDYAINTFLKETNKALINGETIRLVGSFTLKTAMTKPRTVMNFQTKKQMTVPAKRVPKIKFSEDLKEKIAKKK